MHLSVRYRTEELDHELENVLTIIITTELKTAHHSQR